MKKSLNKPLALMLCIALLMSIFAMTTSVSTAATTYSYNKGSIQFGDLMNGERIKVSGKYFHCEYKVESGMYTYYNVYCSKNKTGSGYKVMTNKVGSYSQSGNFLTNGSKIYYVSSSSSSSGLITSKIYSRSWNGKNRTLLKTVSAYYEELILVGVYNGKLYYVVGAEKEGAGTGTLYSYNLSTKKTATILENFYPVLYNGHNRYIYGYDFSNNSNIAVVDLKNNKIVRHLADNSYGLKISNGKLLYIVSGNVYQTNLSGSATPVEIFNRNTDCPANASYVTIGKITTSKIYYSASIDSKYHYYLYTVSTGETTEMTSAEYYDIV